MSAEIGNQLWRLRSSHGAKPIFATPDDLWLAACEYFEYTENNPIKEAKIFNFQGEIIEGTVAKMRVMTETALCIFLDISSDTFRNYKKRDGFLEVTKKIEGIIYSNKFEGASAGLLNPNIIARDLGLADKQDLSSSDGSMTPKAYSPEAYQLAESNLDKSLDDLD